MSLYLRNPHVAPARIGVYPKRRRFDGPADDLRFEPREPAVQARVAASVRRDVTYADFFKTPARMAS